MNYIEALQKLMNGEKVRHKNWDENDYIRIVEGDIHTDYGEKTDLTICDLEDLTEDSWEIYQTEEEKLIEAGKRWELYKTCVDITCDGCRHLNSDLHRLCHELGRENLMSMIANNNLKDKEVDELYKALKGELDA